MEQPAVIDIFVVSWPLQWHIDLVKFLFYIFGPTNVTKLKHEVSHTDMHNLKP